VFQKWFCVPLIQCFVIMLTRTSSYSFFMRIYGLLTWNKVAELHKEVHRLHEDLREKENTILRHG
jgi:hypothetical protein